MKFYLPWSTQVNRNQSLAERRVYLWNLGWGWGETLKVHLSSLPHESEKSNATGCNVSSAAERRVGVVSSGDDRKSRRVCFAAAHLQLLTPARVNHNYNKRVGERPASAQTSHHCAGKSKNLGVFVQCVFNSKQLDSYVSSDYLLLVTSSIPGCHQTWSVHTYANSNLTFLLEKKISVRNA